MRRASRVFAVATVVALIGSAAGLIAAQAVPKTTRAAATSSFLASVAQNLGISSARLTAAFQSAELARVQSLVGSGKLTAARSKRLAARIDHNPFSLLTLQLRLGAAPAARVQHAEMTAAATYLGLSPTALRGDRAAGQSLASIAAREGKSTAALVQAMLAPVEQRLAKEVSSGHLTAAREHAILVRKEASLQRFVLASPRPHAKA